MDISCDRRLNHLLIGGIDASVPDVVANGIVEEDSVLRHHTNVGAQRSLLGLGGKGNGWVEVGAERRGRKTLPSWE